MKRVAVVGLGLIGASFAMALKGRGGYLVFGLDSDAATLKKALADGAIDRAVGPEELSEAEITLVCLHPRAAVGFMLENIRHFAKNSVVADVCGVKGAIEREVAGPLRRAGIRYVGTHPMAGREFSGYDYASADLFSGASFILCEGEHTDRSALGELERLAVDAGFSTLARATAEGHDRRIAYTSQLAHVVSNAYVKSPSIAEERGFSAGSFRDLTRVAKLNASMWSELFLYNAEALTAELDLLIGHLSEYRAALAGGREEELARLLREGSDRKEAFS